MTMNLSIARRVNVTMAGIMFIAMIPVAHAEQTDCRNIADDKVRLACYDKLTNPAAASPDSAAVPAAIPAAVKPPPAATMPETAPVADKAPGVTVVPLDDSTAKARVIDPKDEPEIRIRGRVISCRKDATRKFLFYFDNGQIWRQKDNTNIRWRDCEFDVTITKDVFGYKMVADNEGRQVRISRLK